MDARIESGNRLNCVHTDTICLRWTFPFLVGHSCSGKVGKPE